MSKCSHTVCPTGCRPRWTTYWNELAKCLQKEPIRGSLAHFRPRRGFGLNKSMIKQTSREAKSLSALLPGPHPCVSNKVTFEREQRRRVGRWREALGVREEGGSHRAIWLEETDFIEFFSQEITEIPSMLTDEKMWDLLCISPILNKCHLFLSLFSAKGGQC